jgi:hypothetical protein
VLDGSIVGEVEVTTGAKGDLLERSPCTFVASWDLMCNNFIEDLKAKVDVI